MKDHPEVQFGESLLEPLKLDPSGTVVASMELPWKLASPRLPFTPASVVFVQSMERAELDRITEALPDFNVVLGIGGGMCMDCAKYIAWKRGSRLILIPSIVSVDACVTHLVAVREKGRVRNVGDAQAESLLVDFNLISTAPPRLNRAGAADILSIHTASHDWMLGHKTHGEDYSASIANRCAHVVRELETQADNIAAVNHEGIRALIELFEAENDLCLELGNYRPEEGSEHFFAYNAEHATGKHFIHGELVSLGILLMARLQRNKPEWVQNLLNRLDMLYSPAALGLEPGELHHILVTLPRYCQDEGLPHSIINEADLSPRAVDELIADL